MKSIAAPSETVGPRAPELLLFFRMPKTGGNTMDGPLSRCFPGAQHFDAEVGFTGSALLTRSQECIRAKYEQLPLERRQAIRCVMGTHVPMGLDALFGKPAKYFTIVRHPVDRSISSFFHLRRSTHIPSYPYIKDMTLEQYLESGMGLDLLDQQVRMLSGCAELDAPMSTDGRAVVAAPVERRHLEMAKRNIDEHFLAAAPLEAFDAMLVFLARVYGWPLHRILYSVRNKTPGRPRLEAVSDATRRRLAACNRYDLELFEWVKARFAAQTGRLEPEFSRDLRRFATLNELAQRVGRAVPERARGAAAGLLTLFGSAARSGQPQA